MALADVSGVSQEHDVWCKVQALQVRENKLKLLLLPHIHKHTLCLFTDAGCVLPSHHVLCS